MLEPGRGVAPAQVSFALSAGEGPHRRGPAELCDFQRGGCSALSRGLLAGSPPCPPPPTQ